ncbi:MAG: oligosaccharide flippase family protein [Rikenellaceae bacterium]|nr:oligosaccharide flippase family protein [Rikenellaceae bacterium]
MADKTTQFFKGISIQTIVTLVMGVMEIALFAIMSRLLTKTDFGYYAAIGGVVSIVLSISEAGIGSSIIQKKDASKTFISTAFTWSIIIGLCASVLVFLLAPLLAETIADKTLVVPLRIMSITILPHSIISIGNGILYRKLAFKTIGIINITSYFIASVIGVVMALSGMGLMSIVLHQVIHSLLCVTLLLFYANYPKLKIHIQETKEIVSFSGWLTLGVMFNNLTHQLDKLLLPKWMSVEALGAYNRPAGFVSTISMKLNGIFDSVLFPMLSDIQNDKDRVNNVFLMAVSLLNSFSIVLSAIFFFNAHLIISIFFGENWINLVPVLQIVSISVIFNINGRLVDCFFRSLAYVKLGFLLRVLSAVIMFGSIYIGSLNGVLGVATAIVVANIVNILIKVSCLAIKTQTSIVDIVLSMITAWRPIVPILLVGIPFLIIDTHTWLINVCFAVLFGIIVIVEFCFFPKFIGQSYTQKVYPLVEKVINKIRKR